MSSSNAPVVVTIQLTILCSHKYLIISLIPQETILEVYPRNIVQRTYLRSSSLYSSSSGFTSSSDNRHLIILFISSIALPTWVA